MLKKATLLRWFGRHPKIVILHPSGIDPNLRLPESKLALGGLSPSIVGRPAEFRSNEIRAYFNRKCHQALKRRESTTRPSPLRIPDEQPPEHIPQIAPPLSVDESPVTEASPQDMESDRLRKEIMRSFSSDHTPGVVPAVQSQETEPEEPKSRPQHESTYLPSEYDSYWGEQGIPHFRSGLLLRLLNLRLSS